MSDPIHELDSLKHGGLDVNPLPAAEVRRRGARLRRRNNALIGAGALAIALVVGTPIAVVARSDHHADNVPVAPPTPSKTRSADTAWKQEIPAGFDLTALPPGQGFGFQARAYPVVDDLTLCGRPTFSTGSDGPVGPALDGRGATYGEAGTDGSLGRTLAVYPDEKVAAKALDAFRAGVDLCPQDPNGRGATLVHAPVDTDLPVEESFVFTEQARMDKDLLADLTVFQVARVGNALYVASDHTSAGGPQVADGEVRRLATLSAPVLSDMCVFAAEPCDTPASTDAPPVIGEGAVSAIPADFPLDAGILEPEGTLDGPSAKAEGVPALDLCGRSPWPAQHTVDRLAVTSLIPQYRESRELVTFARTDDATAALAQIREAAQQCPVIPGPTSADDKAVDLQAVDAADLGSPDEAVTLSVAYQQGLGGAIYQFVRVGRAVYGTYVEGEYARDTIGQAVTGVSGKTKSIVPRLCTWTEQGC